jgi:PPOX class probable F420-dependent enzyme
MNLTNELSADRRAHVEARLHGNLMAWFTTVRPSGQPVSVPVWFLMRGDEKLVLYSQPEKLKLRNIRINPRVTLGLDVTDIGRDIVRIDGLAAEAEEVPPANENHEYVVKYRERIGAMFGTPEKFAAMFSCAVVITPTRLWA